VSKSRSSLTKAPSGTPGVILAAGKGTRMKERGPKAAVPVGGKPMAVRVADAMRGAGLARIIAVIGHRGEEVRGALGDAVEYVLQKEQLGTGHATRCAQPALSSYRGPLVVAYADIPLLHRGDVVRLMARHIESDAAATLLTAVFSDPGMLGRILRAEDGTVAAIVEARDATPEQLLIREINVGVYCFDAPLLFEVLAELTDDNAQRQYYLTDAIGMLARRGRRIEALAMELPHRGMGVDTADDLARAQGFSMMGDAI